MSPGTYAHTVRTGGWHKECQSWQPEWCCWYFLASSLSKPLHLKSSAAEISSALEMGAVWSRQHKQMFQKNVREQSQCPVEYTDLSCAIETSCYHANKCLKASVFIWVHLMNLFFKKERTCVFQWTKIKVFHRIHFLQRRTKLVIRNSNVILHGKSIVSAREWRGKPTRKRKVSTSVLLNLRSAWPDQKFLGR